MTKKDFILIAKILKSQYRADGPNVSHRELCKKFCVEFMDVNPNFNQGKFMEACGYSNE